MPENQEKIQPEARGRRTESLSVQDQMAHNIGTFLQEFKSFLVDVEKTNKREKTIDEVLDFHLKYFLNNKHKMFLEKLINSDLPDKLKEVYGYKVKKYIQGMREAVKMLPEGQDDLRGDVNDFIKDMKAWPDIDYENIEKKGKELRDKINKGQKI